MTGVKKWWRGPISAAEAQGKPGCRFAIVVLAGGATAAAAGAARWKGWG